MTTIHFSTTGELLQILDDHPEVLAELRRKLLTDDLLALPESVRIIRETQREMQETQRRIADLLNQTAERLDALESRQAQHDASLARIESSQERMDVAQTEILQWQAKADTRFNHIESQQTEMLKWQAKADARFHRIETSQERMEATQAEMLQWQAKADTRFDRIEGRLGNLTGKDLEREAIDDFQHVALRDFGVMRTGMIQVSARHFGVIPNQLIESYKASITSAADNGLITIEEESELIRADFVARGYSRQDMTPVWFVAEISGTIAFDDIRRAHERADILSRALSMSETLIPLAYGIRVSDEIRALAKERAVRIALQPPPPPPSEEDCT